MVEDVPDADAVDDQFDEYDRLSASADVHTDAWSRTLDDMRALAEERREDGWEVVTVRAGDVSPAAAGADVAETHGLTYVVGAGDADEFSAAFEQGGFPEYDVYRQDVDGRVFVVTELRDPDSGTIILVAGNFWRHQAGPMVQEAKEAGTMYTHVRKLDKTHLGSFEHDGYEKFFPEADRLIDDWRETQP